MSLVSYYSLDRKPGNIKFIKRDAKIAAKQLGYVTKFPDILDDIDNAKTEMEITYILATARERFY